METKPSKGPASPKTDVKQMTRIALLTAVVAVSAQIAVPMPSGVPVTLQTFAVALCGYLLGVKGGLIAMGVYLLLGAVGAPVFASFTGGFQKFAGPTGGFLWGFLPLVALCGVGRAKAAWLSILLGLAGLLLCHALGVTQFALLGGKSFFASAALTSLPFLVKDALSVAGAFALGKLLERRMHFGKARGA